MNLNFIKIPLYKLNYISDINEIKLDENFLAQFRIEYEPEERKNIFKQLEWAVNNPNYDFSSLVDSKRFTNKQIYSYIQKLYEFISKNGESNG